MNQINIGSSPLIASMQRIGMVLAVVGLIGLGATFAVYNAQRFFADYLIGFWYFAGISVTMVFFSALQYLARAGWSASIRRIAENFTGFVPFILLGFIPIIAQLFDSHSSIYEWAHASAATDTILIKKQAYLNPAFFAGRLVLYGLLWFGMMRFIVGNSVKQDSAGSDITPTKKNWKRSAPMVLLYAITITFCSFDLLMSLEPHWFSTIWGVYSFAGHFVAALAIITLMTVALHKRGLLGNYITNEHFHDLGKLMFAFSVFWTYIAFSQYFIIWYANLPEETIYFTFRTAGGWEYFGIALILLHFIAPFAILLRQDVKRNTKVLTFAAIIILISHFVDLVWIIMPAVSKVMAHTAGEHPHPHVMFGWSEFTGMLFFGGIFLFLAARNYQKRSAVAANDPLIKESLEYTT
jgi:hypothetical protein